MFARGARYGRHLQEFRQGRALRAKVTGALAVWAPKFLASCAQSSMRPTLAACHEMRVRTPHARELTVRVFFTVAIGALLARAGASGFLHPAAPLLPLVPAPLTAQMHHRRSVIAPTRRSRGRRCLSAHGLRPLREARRLRGGQGRGCRMFDGQRMHRGHIRHP